MDIALLAPSPVPLAIGGAENMWWALLEHLNRRTAHHADLIKLPTPERTFWEVVDSYRRWAELDVSGYDLVISGKYPSWMAAHPRHHCYLLHPLRGLYDTYPPGWPLRCELEHPEIAALVAFLERGGTDRGLLDECFARIEALRERDDVPSEAFAFPGPLIRQIVHFLDGIGRSPEAIAYSAAQSRTVAERPEYFPPEMAVLVAHPPARPGALHPGRSSRRDPYLFTVSRLDRPKRIDLLIRAMSHVDAQVRLLVSGTGPQEQELRELAAGDSRITLTGYLNDPELVDTYAGALAVPFVPYQEDFGYVTLEAMLSAKPVITTTDSGGPTELVQDGVSGLVVAPDPAAIGAAIERFVGDRRGARRMGVAGRERARSISWDRVLAAVLDGGATD
ncbi:MAG: glycosyltransferase family 4 protein [Solirubrobacteraceae bacterium]